MRTTLDIDDRLLDALMARSPGMSKTKAIKRAIDQYVKTDAYDRVRGLRERSPRWSTARPSSMRSTSSASSGSIASGAEPNDPRRHLGLDRLPSRYGVAGRGGRPDDRLVAHDVLMCGPVAAESLTGLERAERMQFWEQDLSSMAWADIARSDWFVAGDVRAELRARGVQVSLADVLIASAALDRATFWTRDRGFDEIAKVLDGLDLRLLDAWIPPPPLPWPPFAPPYDVPVPCLDGQRPHHRL